MKLTAFDEVFSQRVATGTTSLGVASGSNSAGGDISGGGDVIGTPGNYTVVGLRRQVSLASNIGGTSIGDVLTITSTSPRIAMFATPSNTGSVGSNALTRTLGAQHTIVTDSNSGTAATLDLGGGNFFDLTLTANCSITFANVPSGVGSEITLFLRQDGTGSRTVTWPVTVAWGDAGPPTLSTAAGEVDIIEFATLDGGATWFGSWGGGASATPASTVESETTFGITPAVGTDTEYARQDHTHGTPANPVSGATLSALGVSGPILTSDTPAGSPLVFGDLVQNEAGTDLIYADLGA